MLRKYRPKYYVEVEKICTEFWDIYFLVIMSDFKKHLISSECKFPLLSNSTEE